MKCILERLFLLQQMEYLKQILYYFLMASGQMYEHQLLCHFLLGFLKNLFAVVPNSVKLFCYFQYLCLLTLELMSDFFLTMNSFYPDICHNYCNHFAQNLLPNKKSVLKMFTWLQVQARKCRMQLDLSVHTETLYLVVRLFKCVKQYRCYLPH